MDNQVFVIYKKDNKWIAETKEGDKIEHSEHTSKTKAVMSFFLRHSGVELFYVVIPSDSKEPNETH